MKISKHTHSCLLIEENNTTVLIDPGIFTTQDGTLDIDALPQLDFILITHEHSDHMDVNLIKKLVTKFPSVKIITNVDAAKKLLESGIQAGTEGTGGIKMRPVPHEDILMAPAPTNAQFDLFGRLTHPGDSHSFTTSLEILALPVSAPWGSLVAGLKLAIELRPKIVIPIHEWHWHEKARHSSYQMAEKVLAAHDIRFIPLENQVEVSL